MADRPPTMRDVAARAGVSVATVSKCLRNLPDVSPVTRRAVLRVCEETGYRVNPYVSLLMQSHRRRRALHDRPLLGFVTAFPEAADAWRRAPTPHFAQLFQGASERAQQRGFALEDFWLYRDGMSPRRFSEMLHTRAVRGLLLAPVPELRATLRLTWSYFSVVALGLHAVGEFHRVVNDHFKSMLLAMRECHRLGYRRPGIAISAVTNERLEYRWEAGYLIAARHFFPRALPGPLLMDGWDLAAVVEWVRTARPDVIISNLHHEQLDGLRAAGVRAPEQVGLVGLSVPRQGDRLSGIVQDAAMIGAVAVDQLISLVGRNETGVPPSPATLMTEGRWNPGGTVRPQRN